MNEANLLATARSGEAAALNLLFMTHHEKLFRTVLRITRNRQDAEDAFEDSLLSAFLHLNSFDGRSAFSTWLTRIGINSALMTLRKRRKYREAPAQCHSETALVLERADSAPNPKQRCAQLERARLFRKAIADLRLTIRRPVELHALQGYSIKEVAEELGVSVSTAKGRLHHARVKLGKSKDLRRIYDRKRLERVSRPGNQRSWQLVGVFK